VAPFSCSRCIHSNGQKESLEVCEIFDKSFVKQSTFTCPFALHGYCRRLIKLGCFLYWGFLQFRGTILSFGGMFSLWGHSSIYGTRFVSFSLLGPSLQGVGSSKLSLSISTHLDFLNSTQKYRKWIRVGKFTSVCSWRNPIDVKDFVKICKVFPHQHDICWFLCRPWGWTSCYIVLELVRNI
jgi:hypothetical protein